MRLGFLVLWAMAAALNVLVAWKLVGPYWQTHQTTDWPETTCTIARTWETDAGEDVSYAYAIGGQAYLGERIDFLGRSYPHTFEEGNARPCWYDADDPSSAVLVREDLWRASDWILIWLYVAFAGLMTLAAGAGASRPRKLGAAVLRVMLAGNLVALAWLAQDGGASGVHAVGLTLLAAAACVWLAPTLRWTSRVPRAQLKG